MKVMKLLYYLGAGPTTPNRVDVADLFGKRLQAMGLRITWYYKVATPGGPVMPVTYHGTPARVCGCSTLTGLVGRIANKLQEMLAALHFFGHACITPYDILQVRDVFFAGLLGLLAARLRGRRFVFWLSYPFPEARLLDAAEGRASSPLYSRLAGHLSAWMLYRVILPRVDLAFVQSDQMKADMLRPGITASKLIPVPMGIPDEDMPDKPEASSHEPLVLYLGSLARVRHLEMVLQAFSRVHKSVPESRLAIVGDGDVPEDRASLEREVRRLQIEDAVVFTGHLPRQQALLWIRRAAICLSPIYPNSVLRVSSPTKLIEYMAFSKPVVANDNPPEQATIMEASGAGICTPWDDGAFACAIAELLADPERCSRAGQDGRCWVTHFRMYSLIASDVKNHYQKLMAARTNSI